jgi:hypothetical protein
MNTELELANQNSQDLTLLAILLLIWLVIGFIFVAFDKIFDCIFDCSFYFNKQERNLYQSIFIGIIVGPGGWIGYSICGIILFTRSIYNFLGKF